MQTRTDSQKRQMQMRKNILLELHAGLPVITKHFNDGPQDVTSFFCKATCLLKNLIGTTSSCVSTVAISFDRGTGPNLINKDFLPPAWKEAYKLTKLQPMQRADSEMVSTKGAVPLFFRIGKQHVHGWFGILENLADGVLLAL